MQALVAVFVSRFVSVVFQILSDLFLFLDCVCFLFIKLKFDLHLDPELVLSTVLPSDP